MVTKLSKFKFLLILVAISSSYQIYIDRIYEINSAGGNITSAILYIILFLLLLAVLTSTAYIKSIYIRLLYGSLFSFAFLFGSAYARSMNETLIYPSFVSMMNARGFIGDAYQQFQEPLWATLPFALLLFVGITLKPPVLIPWQRIISYILPVFVVIGLSFLFFIRGGTGANGLPGGFSPLIYSSLYFYELTTNRVAKRNPVNIAHKPNSNKQDILYIIDESIRGDYLDINSEHGVFSGLATSYSGIDIYNYGIVPSIATCSAGVNVTLRFGGTRDNYVYINSSMPSIWEYAKEVGLKTVYLDAQRDEGDLQNYMDKIEVLSIDDFIQFHKIIIRDRDIAIADHLIKLINNDTAEFILVNKSGAHFTVNNKYPEDYLKYKPALPLSDNYSGFSGSPEEWRQYRNSYRNTILWTVGNFFSILLNKADMNKATIIYTSDHGQDFHERGNKGINTHCGNRNVNIEEGIVPLIVIKGKQNKHFNWGKTLKHNFQNSSHYNIFPTLLTLMDYEYKGIKEIYGYSLLDFVDDPFTFNTNFNARLGDIPKWDKIDLDLITYPSPADYTN